MVNYITHLDVSLNVAEAQDFQSQGYRKIDVDLNKGAGGNSIYLWYKCGSTPITNIQLTFKKEMADGLISAGYKKIDKDLNAGNEGNQLYLWYIRASGEFLTPIVEIKVTTDAKSESHMVCHGWERLACNLNRRAGGNWIHIWVKREKQTYICDVTATDSYATDADNFEDGYIRVDENTNRGAGGSDVFIWYRQTTDPKRALTDLQISTNDRQYQQLQQQNYKIVSVNLNEGTGGNQVHLWYKKDGVNNPIQAIILLLQCSAATVQAYQKAGVNVIERNLNTGNGGFTEYLCVYQ